MQWYDLKGEILKKKIYAVILFIEYKKNNNMYKYMAKRYICTCTIQRGMA